MSDPDRSKGHRFTKGHQKFGGRQKGAPNKNIREHALTGLERGGANKARKAGKNGKVNGLAYFFEDLAEKNPAAAATLAGKLISTEPDSKTGGTGYAPPSFNIVSVENRGFLTEQQIEFHKINKCLPPDDNESHSTAAVKFHNKHKRYPTSEELAAASAERKNNYDDTTWYPSVEPVFTPGGEEKLPDPIIVDSDDSQRGSQTSYENVVRLLTPKQREMVEQISNKSGMSIEELSRLSDDEGIALARRLGFID